jgi:hypothetical protein
MDELNEADLLKIRQAFEKDSLIEALNTLVTTLEELGYKRVDKVSQYDIYLSPKVDIPELSVRV